MTCALAAIVLYLNPTFAWLRKPEHETPTKSEPHDDIDSSTSDEGDDEMVASPPKRYKAPGQSKSSCQRAQCHKYSIHDGRVISNGFGMIL